MCIRDRGEQHAYPPLGVRMENDQKAIARGLDVDPRAIADFELLVVQPDSDRDIIDPGGGNKRNRQQQRNQHTDNIPASYDFCCTSRLIRAYPRVLKL